LWAALKRKIRGAVSWHETCGNPERLVNGKGIAASLPRALDQLHRPKLRGDVMKSNPKPELVSTLIAAIALAAGSSSVHTSDLLVDGVSTSTTIFRTGTAASSAAVGAPLPGPWSRSVPAEIS
jgi:hypothetical protein